MFSPAYYLIVGLACFLLQTSIHRKIYVLLFFLFLLTLPVVKQYYGLQDYIYDIAIGWWLCIIMVWEENITRRVVICIGTICSYSVAPQYLVGGVEITIAGMFWRTQIDSFLERLTERLRKR